MKIWADTLGTTPAYLLGETDDPSPPHKEKPDQTDELEIDEEFLQLWRGAAPEQRDLARQFLRLKMANR